MAVYTLRGWSRNLLREPREPQGGFNGKGALDVGFKYRVVFMPKYRKKAIFGATKKRFGDVFHDLAKRWESRIEQGHLMPDHVHSESLNSAGGYWMFFEPLLFFIQKT